MISFILVRPQIGENVGAAARNMANFGFKDLRLVAPRDTCDLDRARTLAKHAAYLIDDAKVFNSLEEAVADLNVIYATTKRERFMNKPAVSSHEIANQIQAEKVGILFGPEASGLTNQEVAIADKILHIPVAEYGSINLAQAVCIVAYELMDLKTDEFRYNLQEAPATSSELSNFLSMLNQSLDEADFYQVPEKKETMQNNITSLFKRIQNLTGQDVRTLHGIMRALAKSRA